jgi:hypothetical protein
MAVDVLLNPSDYLPLVADQRMISYRLDGGVLLHVLKPSAAATRAASRSDRVAAGTVPSTLSSTGLSTGWPGAFFHWPPM